MTAAMAPVLVGGALAKHDQAFSLWPWLFALLGACFIQLGTNYANDVYDHEKGADTADRQGPLRVTSAGLVTPQAMKRAMFLAFFSAALCGVVLVTQAGWPIVVLGLASITAGIAYTGGPYPLGYHGLGDVFVFAFFGIAAVVGTYFVQTGHVPLQAWLWSLPVGASCTAILVVNNLRDIATDTLVGKRTLAVRWGPNVAWSEYVLLALIASIGPVALAVQAHLAWLALPLLALPLWLRLAWQLRRAASQPQSGLRYNALLGATARAHLITAILAAVGLWLC